MSKKSVPGDGTHGKGDKGITTGQPARRGWGFVIRLAVGVANLARH